MTYIYEGSSGVKFTVYTYADLTDATLVAMKVKLPSGTEATWSATVAGTATAGILEYISTANDLTAGNYFLQAYVVLADGKTYRGDTALFTVRKHYD